MKIIYCTIPMKSNLDKGVYKVYGNSKIENDREVIFPINSVLEKSLTKGEKVKVVLLAKLDINDNYINNIKAYKDELELINNGIGAEISYEVIKTPFNEGNPTVHSQILKDMIGALEKDCEVYCDITYGPKSTPILLMNVLTFAEKFYNAEVKDIVYGQADFVVNEDGKSVPTNRTLCNLRSLYYINSITNTLQCNDDEEAKKILDVLLNM